MARINVGLNPKYLFDQHLIAESVEITMVTGSLVKNNFKIKSEIPPQFKLGKGHMNFFKNKLLYLYKRLEEVNKEMLNREFSPGTKINLNIFPEELINDWEPTFKDSLKLRNRIVMKIAPKPPYFWRYRKEKMALYHDFIKKIIKSKLYFV